MPEVLNMSRSYEASVDHMKKMREIKGECESQISSIKHKIESADICGRCGLINQEIVLLAAIHAQHVVVRSLGQKVPNTKN